MQNKIKKEVDIHEKVLLLDFDGTIVETEILAKKVIDVYFHERKLLKDAPLGEMIIGRTWKLACQNMVEYARTLGVDLGPPDELMEEFKARYRAKLREGAPVIPGFKEKLPLLKSKSKFLGIVTGSDHEEVELILRAHGMEKDFKQIWAYGDYEYSKPSPSPYLTAMKALNAKPQDCLIFEDSSAGMESAYQAGVKWVQVAYEAHSVKPDPRSLFVIHDWTEISFA